MNTILSSIALGIVLGLILLVIIAPLFVRWYAERLEHMIDSWDTDPK